MQFVFLVVLRWMHILAAITAVGGSIFMLVALHPAASTLGQSERAALAEGVRARWAKWVAAAILFLLVSGLVNFIRMAGEYKLPPLYHALFGIKFLLALAVFAIASILTGRSSLAQRIRQNPRPMMTLNVALAVIVVCISGVMRTMDHGPLKSEIEPPAAQQPSDN